MKPVHNIYCTQKDDRVVPHKCKCCEKCWLFVMGSKLGQCVCGGPYTGYERVE